MKVESTPYQEGDPDFPICLIGEAPSHEEMRKNRPFVGPAGQLLDRCLHAEGITRARCYIINVFEEPVVKPRDDQGKICSRDGVLLWTSKKGFTEAGMQAAYPAFKRARECKANVIVPMGAPALSLCLDARPITKWRGSILPGGEQINHRKIIPTIHPSAALRGKYEWRYLIMSDLKKVKREAAYPEIKPLSRKLLIDPTFEEAVSFLKRCREARAFNTDIEVLRKQVDCFSLAYDLSEAMCITLLRPDMTNRFSESEERIIWELYAQLLGDPEVTKINQNITFDLAALLTLNKIVPRGLVHDPMVAHSIMYPFLEKGLGVICSMNTDEPYYKDDGTLQDSPTVEDFSRRWEYNAKDSIVSLESWLKLSPDLDSDGYRATYDMTMSMVSSLVYMMVRGINVNVQELEATKQRAYLDLAKIIDRAHVAFKRHAISSAPKTADDWKALYKIVFPDAPKEKRTITTMKRELEGKFLMLSSPAALGAYFYKEKDIKPYLNDAGAPTVDDLAMSRIVRKYQLEEARVVQEYRKLSKMISTYLEMGFDADNRVRCSFNLRGTWTGRLSSSQTIFDTGGNFQNLTEEFQCFLETSWKPGEANFPREYFEEVEKCS